MSLTRQTQKVFGSNANANQLAAFGTMKTGTPVYSSNLSTLQTAAYTQGWSEAILDDKAPYMEEMNAVQYGLSYQIAYLLQEGVGAYDANTNYSDTSIVKTIENGKLYFYRSLSDNNIGHALTNSTYWEKINISDLRNIGEIVQSTIPLTDAGLHLLDGSLLSGSGSYGAFVTYIANLYTADPTANYFTTEANWQSEVSAHGVCGKFVYDSINNTVRLPKITGFIEGASGVANLGDLTEAGLPNITGNIGGVRNDSASITPSGAISVVSSAGNFDAGGGLLSNVNFDASRSSSIYGNSSTVQPQAIKVLYYIVIATSVKTNIEVDIDQIEADLAGKADKDLNNCIAGAFESVVALAQATGKATVVGWGMPDYANGLSISSPTSSSPFTAPSDGVYVELGLSPYGNDTSYLNINGVNSAYGTHNAGGYYDSHDSVTVPLNKGDEIYWTTGLSSYTSIFYPLKGAN